MLLADLAGTAKDSDLPSWERSEAHITADPVWQQVKGIAPNLQTAGFRNAREWTKSYLLAPGGGTNALPDIIRSAEDIRAAQAYLVFLREKSVEVQKKNMDAVATGPNMAIIQKIVAAWRFMEESQTGFLRDAETDEYIAVFSRRLQNAYSERIGDVTKPRERKQVRPGNRPWEREGLRANATAWDNAKLARQPDFVTIVLSEQAGKVDARRIQTLLRYYRGYEKEDLQEQEQAMVASFQENLASDERADLVIDGKKCGMAPPIITAQQAFKLMMNQHVVQQVGKRSFLRDLIERRVGMNLKSPHFAKDPAYEKYWQNYLSDIDAIESYLSARDYLAMMAASAGALDDEAIAKPLATQRNGLAGGLPRGVLKLMPALNGGADFNSLYDVMQELKLLSNDEFLDSIADDDRRPALDRQEDENLTAIRRNILLEFGADPTMKPSIYTRKLHDMFQEHVKKGYRKAAEAFSRFNKGEALQRPERIWSGVGCVVLPRDATPCLFSVCYLASVGVGKNINEWNLAEVQDRTLGESAEKGALQLTGR